MNSNRKYRDERDFAYKRIENEEREFRSFIKLDDLIIQQMKKKYGVEMNIECIEELTQYIISILNITFCIVKGNDLLNIVEKKINVIQIAIFLGIPINESFLKELMKTYS